MLIELPFANDCHWACWERANCSRCAKSTLDADGWAHDCDILNAIFLVEGGVEVGIPAAIATRMGLREDEERFVWKCGEWEARQKL